MIYIDEDFVNELIDAVTPYYVLIHLNGLFGRVIATHVRDECYCEDPKCDVELTSALCDRNLVKPSEDVEVELPVLAINYIDVKRRVKKPYENVRKMLVAVSINSYRISELRVYIKDSKGRDIRILFEPDKPLIPLLTTGKVRTVTLPIVKKSIRVPFDYTLEPAIVEVDRVKKFVEIPSDVRDSLAVVAEVVFRLPELMPRLDTDGIILSATMLTLYP